MTLRRTSARRDALLAGILCGLVVLGGFAVGSALAGDQVAVLAVEPHDVDADSGETFDVDVLMRTEGGHSGEGVERVDLVVQYHPEYVEIEDVEGGPWLHAGEETDVEEALTIVDEEGTTVFEQWRDPVAGGATGSDHLATLTVSVADDADPAETTISLGSTSIDLERQQPIAVHDQEVTLSVDGGEEEASFDHDDPDAVVDAAGSTENADESEADDAQSDDGATDAPESADTSTSDDASGDAVPGFTAGLAGTSFFTVVAVLTFSRRRGA